MRIELSIVALLSLAVAPAHGESQKLLVVDSFAVPVAVPVSPYSTFYYQSTPQERQSYAAPVKSKEEILAERIADRAVERILERLQESGGDFRALEKPTLFSQTCAKCHATKHADGRPVFGRLADLTDQQRLRAIDAIVTDKMPKGGKLSPDQAGALIRELSSVSASAAGGPPTPKPEGEASHENGY